MRSRWIFLVLALGTAAVCARLGLWQMDRHLTRKRVTELASVTRQMRFRPYPDSATLGPDVGIVVRGTFDHARDLVLRGRAHDGAPGVEIATPFRVAGTEQAIVVIRGFVPSDNAMSVDRAALQEPGERTVRGFLFTLPAEGTPIVREGETTWDRIPGAWLKVNLPYPVASYALWQEKDSGMTGMPIRLGAPALDKGPHFNYALQWFGFAIIFALGGIVFAFRKRNENGENAVP